MSSPEPVGLNTSVRAGIADKAGVLSALKIFKTKLAEDFNAIRRAAKYREAKAHVFLFRPSFHLSIMLRLSK
jgi:hypothetical protein